MLNFGIIALASRTFVEWHPTLDSAVKTLQGVRANEPEALANLGLAAFCEHGIIPNMVWTGEELEKLLVL